jgi:hypothetical protein
MALDHFVSQVHLKNFYAPELGERMYGIRKSNLKKFQCDSYSQCRIEEGSTNPYLQEPRVIEDFLKDVEPRYNASLEKLRANRLDPEAIFCIAGFIAYVSSCSPAAMRIHTEPLKRSLEVTAAMLEARGDIPPAPPELGGKLLTELLASGEVTMAIDPKYPQSIGIQSVMRRLSLWGNSRWDILLNEDAGNPFFTSDFPVAIEISPDPRILNRLVPLAPNLAIRILPDFEQRKGEDLTFSNLRVQARKVGKQDVNRVNTAIVQCAESTVYSSHDRPWVFGFVSKNRQFRIEPETAKLPSGSGQLLISTMRVRPSAPTEANQAA